MAGIRHRETRGGEPKPWESRARQLRACRRTCTPHVVDASKQEGLGAGTCRKYAAASRNAVLIPDSPGIQPREGRSALLRVPEGEKNTADPPAPRA